MKSVTGFTIIIIVCFCAASPVAANGVFFDREKFVEDTKLRSDDSRKNFIPPGLSAYNDIMKKEDESIERFVRILHRKKQSPGDVKRSSLSGMGISISRTSGFFSLRGEPDLSPEDEMMSRILETLPSIFEKNSRGQSLEALGKIIEPRINIYFEF